MVKSVDLMVQDLVWPRHKGRKGVHGQNKDSQVQRKVA